MLVAAVDVDTPAVAASRAADVVVDTNAEEEDAEVADATDSVASLAAVVDTDAVVAIRDVSPVVVAAASVVLDLDAAKVAAAALVVVTQVVRSVVEVV